MGKAPAGHRKAGRCWQAQGGSIWGNGAKRCVRFSIKGENFMLTFQEQMPADDVVKVSYRKGRPVAPDWRC
jgi:hypothetical protein